jgi:type I restriction enzyme S subunit
VSSGMAVASAKLGDVAIFVRGITFKPDDLVPLTDEEAVACMRTKNVQVDLSVSDVWGVPRRFVKNPRQFLKVGDILVSTANSWNLVGKCCWVPNLPWPATLGGFISALRPIDERVEPRYLYRWFASEPIQAMVRACARQTTNIANLSFEQCSNIMIPLPPLDEQRRIAAILDQADDLRRTRREALKRLETFLHADFINTFCRNPSPDWPNVPVGDISTSIRTGPFGSQLLHSEFTEDGIAVLGIDNAVNNEFRWDQRRFISETKYKALQRYRVYPRDLLITIMGTCGRAAIVPADIPLAINTKHLCCLTLDETRCLPEYLQACFLRHPAVLHQLGIRERGAVMAGLNMGLIKETVVPLPPVDLQRAFAERVAAVLKLKARNEAHLEKLDQLFACLQQRGFEGAL